LTRFGADNQGTRKMITNKATGSKMTRGSAAPSGKIGSHHKATDSKSFSNTPSPKVLAGQARKTVSAMPLGRKDK
jgi:hypothetical protein